ncbi:unnamed protein product [Ambrosiozyma monospora]|uniref:Unnamed protein product n=1 Tax=Ambrosiozyma monospora TaxID=43982 RepID=A0ACB5T928_AMBMO|nr:unnamed protein product [Ambrosiozyma monospora]
MSLSSPVKYNPSSSSPSPPARATAFPHHQHTKSIPVSLTPLHSNPMVVSNSHHDLHSRSSSAFQLSKPPYLPPQDATGDETEDETDIEVDEEDEANQQRPLTNPVIGNRPPTFAPSVSTGNRTPGLGLSADSVPTRQPTTSYDNETDSEHSTIDG